MKKECSLLFVQALSLVLWLCAANPAGAQGAKFAYQGRLTEAGTPSTGTFEMQFKLFDVPEVGAGVQKGGTLTDLAVVAKDGVFTVTLDFGAAVFDGSPRFLELSVKKAGTADSPSLLVPRQAVTPVPYAIHTLSATTAATATTLVKGAAVQSLNTLRDDVTLAAGPNVTITRSGNTLTIDSVGGGGGSSGLWSLNGTSAYYNSGSVGIGTDAPAAGLRLEVDGVTRLAPGGSGGYVQFGTPNGETGLGIIGANRADIRFDGSTLKLLAGPGTTSPGNGLFIDTLGHVSVSRNLLFGSQPRQMLNLFGTGFGVGVQTADLYLRSGAGFAWHVGGTHNDATYNSGGGTTVATLDLTTGLDFGSRLGQHLSLWGGTGARRFAIGIQAGTIYTRTGSNPGDGFAWFKGGGHDDQTRNPGGGKILMTLDEETGLFLSGQASVRTLTIRGGADLAEPFLIKERAAKGSVMVIDDEFPGQLKLSTQAYDTRVAGIVSGANGINPGIALHQEGMLEGGQNVALSGRVYVQADASSGAIKPGDLLTTSDTPGHAMKVGDPTRAQGAILGKAMTGLKAGKGTVLVLVTLQ